MFSKMSVEKAAAKRLFCCKNFFGECVTFDVKNVL